MAELALEPLDYGKFNLPELITRIILFSCHGAIVSLAPVLAYQTLLRPRTFCNGPHTCCQLSMNEHTLGLKSRYLSPFRKPECLCGLCMPSRHSNRPPTYYFI